MGRTNTENKRRYFGLKGLTGLGVCLLAVMAGGLPVYGAEMVDHGLAGAQDISVEEYAGYVEVPYTIHSIQEGGEDIDVLKDNELPTSYDAREHGVITSVKRQNPWGNCWSFAAMSALESSLLSDGYSKDIDLSEYHLNYYSYQFVTDPLNGTAGDGFTYTGGDFADFLEAGGNILVSYHALTNWMGAVEEEVTGYYTDEAAELENTIESAYLNDIVHVQQMYQLSKTDADAVKKEIMEHGSLTAAFYYKANYYNSSTGGYYNNVNSNSNHAVAVVGWDDNFSKENFKAQPSSDGAWLVKNSWGTTFGQDGYLWISYEDTSLGDAMCLLLAEDADNYDNNYQYDGSFYNTKLRAQKEVMVSNIFQIQSGDTMEELKAVAFELGNTNVDYSIQIYGDLREEGNPLSGTPLLQEPVTGTTLYQGYYTVELPQSVFLKPGQSFAVVITFAKEDHVDLVAEKSYVWNKIEFVASAGENISMLSTDGGDTWSDVGKTYKGNLRIKAFTCNTQEKPVITLPFTDVQPADWQYPFVANMYEKGYMTGKTEELFGTNDILTRSQFVTILYAMSSRPECAYSDEFSDVEEGDWFALPVSWAVENGITAGYAGGSFGSEDSITREQMVLMLYRYAEWLEADVSFTAGNLEQYPDVKEVSDYAATAMDWAVEKGMISGRGDFLAPLGETSRGECATIITRFLESYEKTAEKVSEAEI